MIFYLLGLLSYYRLTDKPVPVGVCLTFFGVATIPPVTALYLLIDNHWTFQLLAFACGLFCWTFLEYLVHRFWIHNERKRSYQKDGHIYHHTFLETILLKKVSRIIIVLAAVIYAFFCIEFNKYFLLPAGIITGFAIYNYIHALLHKNQPVRLLRSLTGYHRLHHNVHVEKCFGVTNIWWDLLFNTAPVSGKPINLKLKNLFSKKVK